MPFRVDPNLKPTSTGFRPQEKTLQGFIGNVGKSGMNMVGGIATSALNVLNPNLDENTLVNLGRTIYDTGGAIAGDRSKGNKFNQLADFYKTRYGGWENIGNTLYNDPVGAAMDVSMVTGGAGSLAKAGGFRGTANIFNKVSEFSNPISLTGKGVGMAKGTMEGILNKGGDKLLNESENIMTKGVGNPVAQAKLEGKYGIKPSKWLKEQMGGERSPELATDVKNRVGGMYDTLAMESGKTAQLQKVVDSIDNAIKELSSGANKYSESAQSQVAELLKRKAQVIDMAGGTIAMPGGTTMMKDLSEIDAPISDLTTYRRALDTDIPKSMFNLDSKGSGTAMGAKKMRDILRGTINESDPRLKTLGNQYGMAKGMEKILTDSAARGNNRQMLNFSKLGTAGVGGMLGGIPGAAAGFVTEQIANHPRTLMAASNAMEAGGKFLKGAKLPNIKLPMGAMQVARINSNLSQKSKQQSQEGGVMKQPQQSAGKLPSTSPKVASYKNTTTFVAPLQKAMPKSNLASFGKVKKVTRSNAY